MECNYCGRQIDLKKRHLTIIESGGRESPHAQWGQYCGWSCLKKSLNKSKEEIDG